MQGLNIVGKVRDALAHFGFASTALAHDCRLKYTDHFLAAIHFDSPIRRMDKHRQSYVRSLLSLDTRISIARVIAARSFGKSSSRTLPESLNMAVP